MPTIILLKEKKSIRVYTQDLGDNISLELVKTPAGTFTMGAPEREKGSMPDQRPQHNVTLESFLLGRYPVTQKQWQAIAKRTDLKVSLDLEPDPSYFKEPYQDVERWQRPVEQVNWFEAEEFCKRLAKLTEKDYKLPSEAQWEYACRGQTEPLNLEAGESYPPFHYGETLTSDVVNYDADYTYGDEAKGEYRNQTTPVGQFYPNAFGLYDMHGNVSEWCEDDWHENYEGAPTDGSAWSKTGKKPQKASYSVLRGGSWLYVPVNCRSACRIIFNGRAYRYNNIGFRVLCVVGRTR